jgi:chromosome segregation ATPase
MIIITEATKEILKWTMISLSTAFIAFIGGSFILGALLDIYSTTGKKKDIDNDFTSVEVGDTDELEKNNSVYQESNKEEIKLLDKQKKELIKKYAEKDKNDKIEQQKWDEIINEIKENQKETSDILDNVENGFKKIRQDFKEIKEKQDKLFQKENDLFLDNNQMKKEVEEINNNLDKVEKKQKILKENMQKKFSNMDDKLEEINKDQNKLETNSNELDKSLEKTKNDQTKLKADVQEIKSFVNTYVAETGISQNTTGNNIGSCNNV